MTMSKFHREIMKILYPARFYHDALGPILQRTRDKTFYSERKDINHHGMNNLIFHVERERVEYENRKTWRVNLTMKQREY